MERYVYCVSMIEPEAVMGCRLTKGRNRQTTPEGLQEKLLDLWRICQRPWRAAIKAEQSPSFAIAAYGQTGQPEQLITHGYFCDRDVRFREPLLVLFHQDDRLRQGSFCLVQLRARNQPLTVELPPPLVFSRERRLFLFVNRQQLFSAGPRVLHLLDNFSTQPGKLGVHGSSFSR